MNKQVMEKAFRKISSFGRIFGRLSEMMCQASGQHRVYMSFVRHANGWYCGFHQDDLPKTPISKRFIFRSKEKIYETAQRGHGLPGAESRSSLDQAVAIGRGGIWLLLTKKQYLALMECSRGV
jgi:hypothetical protein